MRPSWCGPPIAAPSTTVPSRAAKNSRHLQGIAFYIAKANYDPAAFIAAAREIGFAGIGTYPRSGFVHVDVRPAAEAANWGDPFPTRASRFAPEPPVLREVLAESRTIRGGGVAGVATVGAAGVGITQEVLAEVQRAVMPLVPYLDTLRWVFILLALAGIGVAVWARVNDWSRRRR